MSYSNSTLFRNRGVGFGVSLLLLVLMVACDKEDSPAPTEQSITEELLGEWALVRLSGGLAGVDETYTVANSPRTITFKLDDSATLVEDKTESDTTTSSFGVQDVTTRNDTVFFSFASIRENQSFFLAGRPMFIVGDAILQTDNICCDFFDFRFEKT